MDKYTVMNRINLLRAREFGFDHSFVQNEQTRRLIDMILCKYRTVTRYHNFAISTIHLDQTEHRYLLSGAVNGNICCHDLFPSRLVATHPILFQIDRITCPKTCHSRAVSTIRWYPNDNGMFVTLAMDKKLKIWDTNRLQMVDEYDFVNFAHAADIPSVNQTALVAVAHDNGDLRFIDIRSGSDTHTIHAHKGKGVCLVKWLNNSQNLVASGGPDGRVLFIDIRSPRSFYMSLDQDNISIDRPNSTAQPTTGGVAHQAALKSLEFLADSLHLLTLAGDNRMYLWNIQHGNRILVNYGHIPMDKVTMLMMSSVQMKHDRSKSVAYVPVGKNIQIYDVFSGRRLRILTGHLLGVNACIYNPQSVELYSCCDDILVWSAVEKQQNDYENSLKNVKPSNSSKPSLGQILNRDLWSDDEDEND